MKNNKSGIIVIVVLLAIAGLYYVGKEVAPKDIPVVDIDKAIESGGLKVDDFCLTEECKG